MNRPTLFSTSGDTEVSEYVGKNSSPSPWNFLKGGEPTHHQILLLLPLTYLSLPILSASTAHYVVKVNIITSTHKYLQTNSECLHTVIPLHRCWSDFF